jgi:hypothetical protein
LPIYFRQRQHFLLDIRTLSVPRTLTEFELSRFCLRFLVQRRFLLKCECGRTWFGAGGCGARRNSVAVIASRRATSLFFHSSGASAVFVEAMAVRRRRDDKAPRSERLPHAIFDSTTGKPPLLMKRAKRRVIGAILQVCFCREFLHGSQRAC